MDNTKKDLHDVTDTIEHEFKSEKVKESVLLLKQKMCKTHDLIKQYTDKVRETDRLKSDLEIAKKDAKHMICNYNSIMTKTREFELDIAEAKQKNKELINKINEYEITIAADKQNIQQLTCKIKEMEEEQSIKVMEYDLQRSSFEDKIKDLEHELRIFKRSELRKKKRKTIPINDDTANPSIETKSSLDVGINVSLCESELNAKPEVQEKSVMTDEFYNVKDDPYPLFCAKCEAHLNPPPIKKICQIMSVCPPLIEPISSPKKISSSSCSLPSTGPEVLDRNEDIVSSKVLSAPPPMSLCSQYNSDSTVNSKLQSENSSALTQDFGNDSLRNMNVTAHQTFTTNSSSNPDLITTLTSLQNMDTNCAREDNGFGDVLAKNSLSIKKMGRKIRSLQSKIKKLLHRLKRELNTNYCCHHCIMSCNDATSLNPKLLDAICKNVIKFYNEEREACFKNKRNVESGKCKQSIKLKRKKPLNEYNACKNEFSWRIEYLNKKFLQDTLCSQPETVTNVNDITQTEHELLCINESNKSISNVNIFDRPLNDANQSDKELASHSVEGAAPVEDSLVTLHPSIDEICTSNNFLSKDKIEFTNLDYETATETTILSSNGENSIDHADSEIADIITEENNCQDNRETGGCLLKRIRNLKRKNMQENLRINKQKDIELCSNHSSEYYEVAKKRRIAHALKTLFVQPSVVEKESMNRQMESIIRLETSSCIRENVSRRSQRLNTRIREDNLSAENEKNYRISKKCDVKDAVEYIATCNIDKRLMNEENSDLTETQDSVVNNDSIILSTIDIGHVSTASEFDKRDNISVQSTSNRSVSAERMMVEMSNECNRPDILHNIPFNAAKDIDFEKSISSKACIIQPDSNIPYKDSQCDRFTECLQGKTVKATKKITPIAESEYDVNKGCSDKREISKDASDEASKCRAKKNDYVDDDNAKTLFDDIKSRIEKPRINNEIIGISGVETQKEETRMSQLEEDNALKRDNVAYDNVEETQTPISQLHRYINNEIVICKLRRKKVTEKICTVIDEFVKKQLQRLVDSDWENSVHYDVIEKLNSTCGSRIIAKCVVEFLSEYTEHDYVLDNSFTPPAPIMAKVQQKITALLVDLEMSKPTIVPFVQSGIEYKLFKLNNKLQKTEVDSLTRMYVVLARIQDDRERVRIMCCDALYCMGLHAIDLLYTALTCWPDILPNVDVNKGILPMCISFLITSQQIKGIYPKLMPLKALISSYYRYNKEITIKDFVEELMALLKAKRHDGIDTAIILVAKREGTSWTYKNIVRSTLLPMIINHEHPCMYSAFSLLGKLMRTFPLKTKSNTVKDISKQLSDLLQSGEGSDAQQEGITSALLSLSRHEFDIAAQSVMKWIPNKSLRPNTIAQIEAFIKTRTPQFWKCYVETKIYQTCRK